MAGQCHDGEMIAAQNVARKSFVEVRRSILIAALQSSRDEAFKSAPGDKFCHVRTTRRLCLRCCGAPSHTNVLPIGLLIASSVACE